MKLRLLGIFCICACRFVIAQPVEVKGLIKTNTGEPVFNASIKSSKEKKEVFSDPQGNFEIKASPLSTLVISYSGFEDVPIAVKYAPIDTTVVLEQEKPKLKENQEDIMEVNKRLAMEGMGTSAGFVPQFTYKESTQGSRYLFPDWVRGHVVNANHVNIDNGKYLYNYNKMTGELYLTQDKKTAIVVNNDLIYTFTLISPEGDSVLFKKINPVNDKLYTAMLVNGPKYSLLRLTKTKFLKSDYRTDGMTESGNNYDEYADTKTYYLQTGEAGQPVEIKISKKGLKSAIPNNPKGEVFISSHPGLSDEQMAIGFVEAANY